MRFCGFVLGLTFALAFLSTPIGSNGAVEPASGSQNPVYNTPLTKVDAASNALAGQWFGIGGDAVRFGHVWRIDLNVSGGDPIRKS
jgi:hypothetical protein